MLDTLITGARVRTFSPGQPWAEAVGIEGGRIRYVGAADDAPTARTTRHLDGGLVTPGVIDSHNHLLLGFDPDAVSLEGANTLAEVRRRIAELSDARPDLTWICAENAVYAIVDNRRPNAADLAGITDRPVFVTTYDQHSAWLNDAAITALGLDTGGDVPWGKPERDEYGRATGWVTDFYTSAMTTAGLAGLQRDIPMYSPERRYRKLLGSLKMATSTGITTVVEPQVPLAEIELFQRALNEGVLSSRIIAALFHPMGSDGAFRTQLSEAVNTAPSSELLSFGPIKLYADDVIEPHNAWMLDDYANRPGHRGHPSAPIGELTKVITELDRLGLQTHTHATGDGGVRLALDAIEAAAATNGTHDRRHGIVHVECLHPDDLPRFAASGITAAMQPRHASPDLVAGTWMENVGESRWDRAWRVKSLMRSGAHVALSSDWQVGEMDPLVGIYSALTRAGLDGSNAWTQSERIGIDDALRGYTAEGAWAWHRENEFGVIKPGAAADVVAWSEDLYDLEQDPAALLGARAEATWVAGNLVHDAATTAPVVGHYETSNHCSSHHSHAPEVG